MSMYFPTIETDNSSRDFQEQFGGYNHNIRINESEFFDMKNMTGDYYPVLSTRDKRGYIKTFNDLKAMTTFGNKLCYIDWDGTTAHLWLYDGTNYTELTAYANETNISKNDCIKEIVINGAYIIIFEKTDIGLDKGWYINTVNTDDFGYINSSALCSYSGTDNAMYPSDADGNALTPDYISADEPKEDVLFNGYKWLDISKIDNSPPKISLKKWSETQNMWIEITDLYTTIVPGLYSKGGSVTINGVKHTYPEYSRDVDISGFKKGDAIDIKIAPTEGCCKWFFNEEIKSEKIENVIISQFTDKNIIISAIDYEKNTITVPGYIGDYLKNFSGVITFSKKAPLMDYICESNNRLWGCRYGTNRDGEFVNEIYACKQGDFTNWFSYAGTSVDSYAVSVGSQGPWTGCIPHSNSYIYFFKENSVHILYGTTPSTYQLSEHKVRGVQQGSEESLCEVNGTIFYMSDTDFCCYSGGDPTNVSEQLGKVKYKNVSCTPIKNKIYINAQDIDGKWHLFVYNTSTGLWHKEDNIQLKSMCRVGTDIYFVDNVNNLGTLTGTGTPEDDFEWYAETGSIGYSYSDNKYIGRMTLRIKKPLTSEIRVLISYDDSEIWELVADLQGCGTKSYSLPVLPRRCDHFRLRLEGRGECKVFSISKTIEIGSDI